MPPTEDPSAFPGKASSAERRKSAPTASAPEPVASADLVILYLDAGSGRIAKVEGIDAGGAHHEISGDGAARLVTSKLSATLEEVVERAFQAGVDCVLGADEDEGFGADNEPDEDAELSRLLLRSLIRRSAARTLVGRDTLRQVVVGALLEEAAAFRAASAEGAAAH